MQNSENTKNRALPLKTSHMYLFMLQIQTINRLFLSHPSFFLPCLRVKLEKTTKKNKKNKKEQPHVALVEFTVILGDFMSMA